jgi:hypothetical protein
MGLSGFSASLGTFQRRDSQLPAPDSGVSSFFDPLWLVQRLRVIFVLLPVLATLSARADSVVVFNEIMYHPAVNEAAMEWVELHNQMSVDVDLSGWIISGGIDFRFADGTVIPGGGYLLVSSSPAQFSAATGLTNVLGPFSGRLSNGGEKLELRNFSSRLMDTVTYGVDGHWPVGPDGSGVSLAKRSQDTASALAENWTVSALVGGTPGQRNFALTPFEITTSAPLLIDGTWKFEASGSDLGTAWRETSFDDATWSAGRSLFQAGNVNVQTGDPQPVPTVFSSGLGANGAAIAAGSPDPHYQLTQSAQSTPPPPAIAATVIQNHPAWLANDSLSSWLGPVNPGITDVAAGDYTYRTTFSLEGFDPASAALTLNVGADNRLNDVLLNGISQGLSYAGFTALSGTFTIPSGFIAGTNRLEFVTANDGSTANPAGFRVRLAGTARKLMIINTPLTAGRTNYYFRTKFTLDATPRYAALQLKTVVADGAVFYLNGTEVLRWNMPVGPIGPSTLAVSNVTAPTLLGPFGLPNAALVAGTNILAVELHSAATGTANVLFGAALSLTVTNVLVPPAVPLAFNEIASGTNADFWVEVINTGSDPLELGGCVLSQRGGDADHDFHFPPQSLPPGALLELPAATLNFAAHSGDRLFLYSSGGTSVIDAVVVQDQPRGRSPDGAGEWLFPTTETPGASNHFEFHRDVVINEIMYHAPLLPSQPATYGTNIMVRITNSWKYHGLGMDLGVAWRGLGYDDTAWPAGSALFYYTTSVLPAPKQTELSLTGSNGARITTWYFRTPFVFGGQAGAGQLTLNAIVDDGAVYYLNGLEIFRQNMPTGEIQASTFASAGIATPSYVGPLTLSVTNLLAGTNLLAVEVHQFTTNPIAADMAFGVEVSVYGQQSSPLSVRESPESWIELFNRGTNAVNLTGWRLDEGVDFRLAPGTTIPAGGYLVVAKDVGYVQEHYPGITVVGPFTNKLSRAGDYVVLKDAANNPANRVRYFDGGRWPEQADGGGGSLELRDPWADNTMAEAWAASDESARSTWSNYAYRAVARNVLGPTIWNEFVLGLLEAGECLVDDLRVIESPDSAPVSMLQNGSFESGLTAWRVLGDHSKSRVEVDPDQPGNHVLHLVATGPTDHIHNHLETTLANGRAVTDGKTYEISFRAKWLTGNNRLNTRLYFNRVAKTTALTMPTLHGTPGRRNSTFAANIGPTFDTLQHRPIVPQPNQPVLVSLSISDPQDVQAVTLRWSADGGNWRSAAMLPNPDSARASYTNYSAALAGFAAGTLVQFYIEATDGLGATSVFPRGGTNSRACFKVAEGKGLMTQLHRVSLLLSPADVDLLHAPTNVMSNDRIGLTVVYDESEVFYDVGLHLQSSERGRNDSSRVGFTVGFNPDQLFRGVQKGITLDRSGGYSGQGGRHDEILLWHAVNHAGGLFGLECDLVQLFAPRDSEDGTAMVRLAAFDNDYFGGQFENGDEGSRYLLELIYYPTTTTTGDSQSPKLPSPDEVINVDFQDWGSDQELYRWPFLQENQADLDDYSKVIALNKALSLSGTALDSQTKNLMDVDEWLRTLAFKAFTGDGDTYSAGLNHNWKFYFRPADGRALGLLWDMDLSFNQPITTAFPGTGSASTYRLIMLPDNYRRYYNHLLELMTTTVNSTHLGPWAARYAGLLGQNWSGVVSYLQRRADFIRSSMPLSTPFAITSNGGSNFAVTNDHVLLVGTAPLTVKQIEINGVSYSLTWTSLTHWKLTALLPGLANLLVAQGVDNFGNRLTNATDSIIVTNRGVLPPGPVVINEWLADNSGPGGFMDVIDNLFQDWIELYNPNDVPVNLSGFSLTDTTSEPAKWQIPTNTIIAPRGFLLVWADGDTGQNGQGTNGDLHANFQLSRSGEAIALYSPEGALQDLVEFRSQIQNVSYGLFPDGKVGTAYSMENWTPRASNRVGSVPPPGITLSPPTSEGIIGFECGVLPGRTYRVEYKEVVTNPNWTPLGSPVTATKSILQFQDSIGGHFQRYYRVLLIK